MSDYLKYQIALTLVPGIGDVNGKRLVSYCGGVEAIFMESRKALEKIPGMRITTLDGIFSKDIMKRAEQEVDFVELHDIKPLFYLDEAYPKRLHECQDSPMMLYYKGNADLNKSRAVAVVGTRNITEYGRLNCENLVEDLVDDDVLLVSGLAYGVDSCAHRAAVKHHLDTVGVLGHGLHTVYPSSNRDLAKEMIQQGGLLTEYLGGVQPSKESFPRRNRIIAGMVDAVVVVESAMKGGSLITADIANSYNRDVFAYPGKTCDIFSQGCNYLIRTNRASLIENAANLRYIMRWDCTAKKKVSQVKMFRDFTDEEKAIMDVFGDDMVASLDDMIVKTEISPTKLASLLLTLEFDGVLMALPGKRFQRV